MAPDWGTQEILAVDLGSREVVVHTPFGLPFCLDWLPDGRLLVGQGARAASCGGSATGRW